MNPTYGIPIKEDRERVPGTPEIDFLLFKAGFGKLRRVLDCMLSLDVGNWGNRNGSTPNGGWGGNA